MFYIELNKFRLDFWQGLDPTNRKIDIISRDKDGIWKERRRAKRGQMDDWFITKDKQGRRIYGPDENRNNIRSHYKELYELREVPFHPYHETVESMIKRLKEGTPETDPDLWPAPTRADIAKIISKKKNRKATTDWKNEIIKRGGDPMIDLILPVIEAFWNEEKRPDHWGSSIITNIWKG